MNAIELGKYPYCCKEYAPVGSPQSFCEYRPNRTILLIYAFCPECKAAYESATTKLRTNIQNTCYRNVKLVESSEAWTITTSLAYEAHGGDFYSAWVYGVSIPKTLMKAIDRGVIQEAVFLPGGAVSC